MLPHRLYYTHVLDFWVFPAPQPTHTFLLSSRSAVWNAVSRQVAFQFLLLINQMRRLLVVHVLEHGVEPRGGTGFGGLHGAQHGGAFLLLDGGNGAVVQSPDAPQEPIEAHKEVLRGRRPPDLGGPAVPGAVVGRQVMALAVGDGLEQDGGERAERQLARRRDRRVHGEEVVPVRADAGHALPWGAGNCNFFPVR